MNHQYILGVFLLVVAVIMLYQFSFRPICGHRMYSPYCEIKDIPSYLRRNPKSLVIWAFWDSDKIPRAVDLAVRTWRNYLPDHIICLLSEKTIWDFLTPDDVPELDGRKVQFRSDIYRIALLEKYGGLWMDATMLLTRNIYDEWFPQNYDIGGYFIQGKTTDDTHPVFENWFISAPLGSPLISAWKKELYRAYELTRNEKNNDKYFELLRKEGVDLQEIGSSYLWMHGAFLKVTQGNHKYIIKQKMADTYNGPFGYLSEHRWNPGLGVFHLLTSLKTYPHGTIKLRGVERTVLTPFWPFVELFYWSPLGKLNKLKWD